VATRPAWRNERKPPLPVREREAPEPAPIQPLEPLDETQPEVPKVGTHDAPGG
jgi:hypothetical protein